MSGLVLESLEVDISIGVDVLSETTASATDGVVPESILALGVGLVIGAVAPLFAPTAVPTATPAVGMLVRASPDRFGPAVDLSFFLKILNSLLKNMKIPFIT